MSAAPISVSVPSPGGTVSPAGSPPPRRARQLDDALGRAEHRRLGVDVGQVGLGQQLAALLVVGAVEPHHEGHGRLDLGERLDQALGDLVAARDAAEDVEQHGGDLLVGEDHLDRLGDRLGLRAAAGVEEVGGLAAGLGDDVERRHHEPGAVAEDADVAVELDVGEAALLGHLLLRVLAAGVAQLGVLGMAEQRVAVERDLRVERHHPAVARDDQRVDLDEHRLLGREGVIEAAEQRADRAHDVGVDAGLEGEPAGVEVLEAEQRVDVQAGDRVRVVVGDLLDVHPALRGEHHERLLGRAVEDDRRVVLGGDVGGRLDPDLVHGEAADVHPEDRASVLLGLAAVLGDLDAAGLAAAADQHLRLDHARVADVVGGGDRLLDGRRGGAGRHRDAVAREQLLALVLEEVHEGGGL